MKFFGSLSLTHCFNNNHHRLVPLLQSFPVLGGCKQAAEIIRAQPKKLQTEYLPSTPGPTILCIMPESFSVNVGKKTKEEKLYIMRDVIFTNIKFLFNSCFTEITLRVMAVVRFEPPSSIHNVFVIS